MTDSRGLIWRYYLFRMTNSAGFYLPVAIIYLQDREFGLAFVGYAYAVFGVATLAAEIPTGYLGDWLGRRASLAVGSALRALVLVAYPFADTAAVILTLHVVWAIGRSFRSGTQDAWLYELLDRRFDESQFARIEGRGSTVLLVTSAAGAITGGFLYGVDIAYPFLANAGLALLGIPLLFTFPAVDGEPGGGDATDVDTGTDAPDTGTAATDTGTDVFTVRDAVTVLRLQAGRSEVRWLVAYAALFNALFLVTRIYEQPALDAVGVPVAGLGFLYAGFKLVSAGAASAAGWFEERFGTHGVFLSLIPVYGIAYAGIALAPMFVVPVLFLNRGLRVVTRPIRNQYLNDRLDDVGRATVLSGAAMVLAFAGAIARTIAAWGAAAFGPVLFLPVAGVLIALAGGVLWVLVSPVRSTGRPGTIDGDRVSATD